MWPINLFFFQNQGGGLNLPLQNLGELQPPHHPPVWRPCTPPTSPPQPPLPCPGVLLLRWCTPPCRAGESYKAFYFNHSLFNFTWLILHDEEVSNKVGTATSDSVKRNILYIVISKGKMLVIMEYVSYKVLIVTLNIVG